MVNDDLAIFSADPELVSLRHLSHERLQAGLGRCIPPNLLDAPVSSYRISNLRYSPGEKMVVGMTSSCSSKPISLRIFPKDKLQDRIEKAQRTHPDHAFLLSDLSAVAWVFPGERKLDLRLIDDPNHLAKVVRDHRGYQCLELELLHFVPEHTYTARMVGRRDDGSRVHEYLKIYYDESGADTARVMQGISRQLRDSNICIPDDVTYLSEHRLLIQSEIARDETKELSMDAAAFALAKFHNLKTLELDIPDDDPVSEHNAVLRIVSEVFPPLRDEINSLSIEILKALGSSTSPHYVLLHGDAHLGNMFPTVDGRIGFIDLDRVSCGPGQKDLASFLAFKAWVRLRNGEEPELTLWQVPQFLYTYNQYARHPVEDCCLYAQLAHKMLTERIRRGITRGKISSAEEIRRFICFARQCLQVVGPHRG